MDQPAGQEERNETKKEDTRTAMVLDNSQDSVSIGCWDNIYKISRPRLPQTPEYRPQYTVKRRFCSRYIARFIKHDRAVKTLCPEV